ncbi:hypothetical protein CLORY_33470 [Clostridium oryzae]|uniref:Uncharacterized protein n=1 Tax=Clostridium oryzae TaxID=1450648 RepID=A0A1V4IH67_9CLOT|nr:hypothetical protein CLORY_33470 [Clostridium oryzae]
MKLLLIINIIENRDGFDLLISKKTWGQNHQFYTKC